MLLYRDISRASVLVPSCHYGRLHAGPSFQRHNVRHRHQLFSASQRTRTRGAGSRPFRISQACPSRPPVSSSNVATAQPKHYTQEGDEQARPASATVALSSLNISSSSHSTQTLTRSSSGSSSTRKQRRVAPVSALYTRSIPRPFAGHECERTTYSTPRCDILARQRTPGNPKFVTYRSPPCSVVADPDSGEALVSSNRFMSPTICLSFDLLTTAPRR